MHLQACALLLVTLCQLLTEGSAATLRFAPAEGARCANSSVLCRSTCCPLDNDIFACCEYKHAVCCRHQKTCCPQGTTCSERTNECEHPSARVKPLQLPLTKYGIIHHAENNNDLDLSASSNKGSTKLDSETESMTSLVCPDDETYCDDSATCCETEDGSWGCCPIPDAACCEDGKHCCPKGYSCDPQQGTCTTKVNSIPWRKKLPARRIPRDQYMMISVCADGNACNSGSTCCQRIDGSFSCCPTREATCCRDGLHCCPAGSVCEESSGVCEKNGVTVPWIFHSKFKAVQSAGVMCPDHQSMCPDDYTCCLMQDQSWGCCPYSPAVCCSDGQHCCPSGYTCDMEHMTCNNGQFVVPWREYTKSMAATWWQELKQS